MSHWNHRVVRTTNASPIDQIEGEYYFAIHEVYYNDAGEICGMTEDPIEPFGESLEDLKNSLERMMKACDRPILIDGEIEYAKWQEDENEEDDD